MASGVSREAYFETGLELLSDLGYGGLKLAEVCDRLGVTTGSFYHFFSSWPSCTRELVKHWQQASTIELVEWVRTEPWGSADPEVYAVQVEVDKERQDILRESAPEIAK
jgi:AcrR family transcriptional regulator